MRKVENLYRNLIRSWVSLAYEAIELFTAPSDTVVTTPIQVTLAHLLTGRNSHLTQALLILSPFNIFLIFYFIKKSLGAGSGF